MLQQLPYLVTHTHTSQIKKNYSYEHILHTHPCTANTRHPKQLEIWFLTFVYLFGWYKNNNNETMQTHTHTHPHRLLDGNAVMHLDDVSFRQLKNLRALRLEGNMLQHVPTEALTGLPTLEILWVFLLSIAFLFVWCLSHSLSLPHATNKHTHSLFGSSRIFYTTNFLLFSCLILLHSFISAH